MRIAAAHASAMGAIVERDFRVFITYRLRAFSQLSGVILTMTIFHFVSQLIAVGHFRSPEEYFAFVTAGLVIVLVLQSAVGVPALLRHELAAGTFEQILTSPLGAVWGLLGMMVFPVIFSCVIATIGFVLAAAIFSLPVEWSTAAAAVPVALLGAAAFAAIGVVMMASVVIFKQTFGMALIMALLTLTGGVYFPVALLPGWLAWISDIQPFTPTMDLLRHLLLGIDAAGPPETALLKLIAFVVIVLPLSALALRASIQLGRRRGTILEY